MQGLCSQKETQKWALLLDPTRGSYSAPYEPLVAMANVVTHWAMAYSHKTQSFMKNGGQQKCLDKSIFKLTFFH